CRDEDAEAISWLAQAQAVVRDLLDAASAELPVRASAAAAGNDRGGHVSFTCGRGREQYLADLARCQAALAAGESYEVCLTDQISTDASPDPWELYCLLRRTNPAPFAAYLKLGELTVLS